MTMLSHYVKLFVAHVFASAFAAGFQTNSTSPPHTIAALLVPEKTNSTVLYNGYDNYNDLEQALQADFENRIPEIEGIARKEIESDTIKNGRCQQKFSAFASHGYYDPNIEDCVDCATGCQNSDFICQEKCAYHFAFESLLMDYERMEETLNNYIAVTYVCIAVVVGILVGCFVACYCTRNYIRRQLELVNNRLTQMAPNGDIRYDDRVPLQETNHV